MGTGRRPAKMGADWVPAGRPGALFVFTSGERWVEADYKPGRVGRHLGRAFPCLGKFNFPDGRRSPLPPPDTVVCQERVTRHLAFCPARAPATIRYGVPLVTTANPAALSTRGDREAADGRFASPGQNRTAGKALRAGSPCPAHLGASKRAGVASAGESGDSSTQRAKSQSNSRSGSRSSSAARLRARRRGSTRRRSVQFSRC